MAQIDCHLDLKGVPGESEHDLHKKQIKIETWNWGMTQAANPDGGGMSVGKAKCQEIVLVKKFDIASSSISKHCAGGKHIEEAKIFMSRPAGDKQEDYLTITLKQVLITSHQTTVNVEGDINDEIKLAFAEIDYEYKPQKKEGGGGGGVKFGWNVKGAKVAA
jgi:type VI secretion system secreted protein Hcp